jgi:hypothetical protein
MSPRPTRSRTLTRAVTVAAAAVLVGSAAPAALADPAAGDDRTLSCTALLEQAATWPGGDLGDVRVVSMAYDYYLSTQPACRTPQS